jgi:2-octaprenyl-6-methoxyphenol hydroxylase
MTLACALGQVGFSVILLDEKPVSRQPGRPFDGRVSALGRASCRLLEALELWPAIAPDAQPIRDILVSDGRLGHRPSPLHLHFDHLDGAAGEAGEPLGHIIANQQLRTALHKAISLLPRVSIRSPARVSAMERDAFGVTLTLEDGETLRAPLCIAADGSGSPLREMAGIRSITWEYAQTGIVVTAHHERPHDGVAHEYFLPGGPFAILPMTGNRSSLVWTEPHARAKALFALDQDSFDAELRARFGAQWGRIESDAERFLYPLSFRHARDYIADRLALAGDAAHTIHPIAGQGFNLGLRDVAVLAEVLHDARRLGLDIGARTVLERYQSWRRFDNVSLSLMMDMLNRLFRMDTPLARLARDIGMGAFGRIGPLRRLASRHAAGDMGDLPKLLRGEAL